MRTIYALLFLFTINHISGIILFDFVFFHKIFITATCPYDCGGSTRGTCTNPGVCRCNPGYTGTYCMDG